MCEKQDLLQCRLCLRNKKSMISIFKQNGRNNCAIKQAIEDLLNFKVTNTDGLPRTICCDCCSKVMGYNAFKAMCLKSKEILWRKTQEKLLLDDCSDTSIKSTVLLQEEAGISIHANVGVEDSHALSDITLKREPSEDAEPARIDSDLLLGNTLSVECSGITYSMKPVKNLEESDSLSYASTLVRYENEYQGHDEESIHLKLSSSSEFSVADECQAGNLDDLEPSGVRENSINTLYGQPITECRVILTRCDIDEYKALQEKRHLRKRRMSTCKTSAASSPKETGPRTLGGPPYPCSDCWITFSSPEFLLKHKQYCHGTYCPPSIGILNETTSQGNETNERILNGVNAQTKEKSDLVTVKGSSESNLCNSEKGIPSRTGSSIESVPNLSCAPSSPQLSVERTEERVFLGERTSPGNKLSMNSSGINNITPRKRGRIEKKCKRGERKKMYPCKQCPKVFKKPYCLKVHTYIHDGIKPFKCDMCDRSFRTKSLKLNHESYHSDERPFSCQVCSKSYRLKSSLRKHLVNHSQLRPYKCKQCKKTFKRNDKLRDHERIHTGERPYKCNNCPRAFTSRGNLCAHNRIHTGVRPYECPLCRKTFQGSSVLKTHLKVHDKTANQAQPTISRGD